MSGLFGTDGVPDRGSDAKHVGITELILIHDVVVMRFWTEEDMVPEVITDTAAHVDEEVIVADVARAKVKAIGSVDESIEASGLPPNAAHQVCAELLVESGLEDAVEIEKDRTVGLSAGPAVLTTTSPPCGFEVKADAAVEDDVRTDAGIKTTFFGNRRIEDAGRVGRGRH